MDSNSRIWSSLRALAIEEPDAPELNDLVRSHGERLIEAAVSQGLAAALAHQLTDMGTAVPQDLRPHAEGTRFSQAAAMDVLAHIDQVLGGAGVPWVTLKGAVVAARYRNPDLRSFVDIDILVRGSDLGATLDALNDAGIEDVNRNWGNYLEYGVAETPLWAPGLGVDVHWHVVALAESRARVDIDVAGMIERRRRVRVGGIEVWSLDPVDLLWHVCLHAAAGGATRLAWLRDVRELVRSEAPDWDSFVDRVNPMGIAAKVGQVLDRARCVVGADIPSEVPERLCPGKMLRARQFVDSRERGDGLPDRFLRGSPIAVTDTSPAAVARSAATVIGRRVGPTEHWNVGDPEGPLYWGRESGGPHGREAYLRYASQSS